MRPAHLRAAAGIAAACTQRSVGATRCYAVTASLPGASGAEALPDSAPRPSSFVGAGAAAVLVLTGVYAWNLPSQRPKPPHVGSDSTLSNW